jgi:hypothetical protein
MTAVLPIGVDEAPGSLSDSSRRGFLLRLGLICIAAGMTRVGLARAAGEDAELVARTDVQWGRIQRGLDSRTLAACRKAANALAPRAVALLKGPSWKDDILKAALAELKKAGVETSRRSKPDSACGEAERLRNEAGSTTSAAGAATAAATAAAQVAATTPVVGPVIAAVLAAVAAVIVLLGQIMAKAKEDQAAAKEKQQQLAAMQAERETDEKRRIVQADLVKAMEARDDCTLFARKLS